MKKGTIKKYRKAIFIYTIIACFALFINLSGIEGRLKSSAKTGDPGFTNVYVFTHRTNNATGFWPFVPFVEHIDNFDFYATHKYDHSRFNGIFYGFGIVQFIFYMGVLVAFLIYKEYIT